MSQFEYIHIDARDGVQASMNENDNKISMMNIDKREKKIGSNVIFQEMI